jgi:hypothetical protein
VSSMNFEKRLEGLPRPLLVEAVYLAGRYLTHGLTEDVFLRQLQSDVKTAYSDRSVKLVLELMSEIQTSEGVDIQKMPMSKRFALASELNDALWADLALQQTDANVKVKVESALADLRTRNLR